MQSSLILEGPTKPRSILVATSTWPGRRSRRATRHRGLDQDLRGQASQGSRSRWDRLSQPGSLERKTLWLAPEQIADRDQPEVVELMSGYTRLLLDTRPAEGDDRIYNVIVVAFTDLSADSVEGVFRRRLRASAVPSYVENGLLFGPYFESNKVTALHNSNFRPFQSPVPFLFVRHGVTSDWEFFLDDDQWLNRWARRYGESGVQALAEELRRLRWREAEHSPLGGT
jgi:hypothetical protein